MFQTSAGHKHRTCTGYAARFSNTKASIVAALEVTGRIRTCTSGSDPTVVTYYHYRHKIGLHALQSLLSRPAPSVVTIHRERQDTDHLLSTVSPAFIALPKMSTNHSQSTANDVQLSWCVNSNSNRVRTNKIRIDHIFRCRRLRRPHHKMA